MIRFCSYFAVLALICSAQELPDPPRPLDPPNPPRLVDLMPDFSSVAVHSDGRKAWTAGNNGCVYLSADGGSSWNIATVPGQGALSVIRFHADGERGWAGGRGGRLAYTTNGGITWSLSTLPPNEKSSVEDIAFDAAGKLGIAVGWPAILMTEDGGVSWKRVHHTGRGYNAVAFDAQFRRGIAAGSEALVSTEDGGKTWKEEPGDFQNTSGVWISPDGERVRAFSLPSVNHREKNETYWFTKSGPGGTWTRTKDLYIDNLGAVAFQGAHAVIAEKEGIHLKTAETPLRSLVKGKFIGVAFAGTSDTALAVGAGGRVDRSEDGGKSWRTVHQWPAIGKSSDISMQRSHSRVWVGGEKVHRADYPGLKFVEQKISGFPEQTGEVSAIQFSRSGETGWMTTRRGHVLLSTDKGESWSDVHQYEGERELRALAFDSAGKRGMAVGRKALLISENGGQTWSVGTLPSTEAFLNSVWISPDGKTAFAVTGANLPDKGRVYRSLDHGSSWQEVPNPTNASLYAISFSQDGKLGWIAGSGRTMLFTENAGRTWSKAEVTLNSGSSLNYTTFDFPRFSFERTGRYGWAIGGYEIFRTVDFGHSWFVTDRYRSGCEDITMTDTGNAGWALCGGTIHRTLLPSEPPQINRFAVNAEDHALELSAKDPDSPPEAVWGSVEVSGRFLGLDAEKLKRRFRLPESESVVWPADIFRENVTYTFTLHLSDGWNVSAQQFRMGGNTPATEPAAPSLSAMEVEDWRGLNLTGVGVLVDGREWPAAQVLTRGSDGAVSVKPSPAILQSLPDGFHGLALTRGDQQVIGRIGFYKQQLSLKLFRPYGKSYALIIAVGDYAPDSGYRKLPSAVAQARQLEAKMRAQGFTVLPLLLDRDATKGRIEAAIRSAPASAEDRLLVYFGGHGDNEKGFRGDQVGYLVPYDGRKTDLWGTSIPLEKVLGEYASRLKAKHVLFALDSCQAGLAVSRGASAQLSQEELKRFKALAEIESLSTEPGRTVLAAGTAGQDAIDVSGGIFTTALTDGISGKADADHNGVVDYFELFAYVWGRVNSESRQWLRKQQPSDAHIGNGRWVFVYN